VPTAAIDYFYQYRDDFTESGADSLSLKLAAAKNRSLRTHLGLSVSKDVHLLGAMTVEPLVQLGWAHEKCLDDRILEAALVGQPDTFAVAGDCRSRDMLTTGVGITISSDRNFSLFARLGLEYRRDRQDQTLSTGLEYRF